MTLGSIWLGIMREKTVLQILCFWLFKWRKVFPKIYLKHILPRWVFNPHEDIWELKTICENTLGIWITGPERAKNLMTVPLGLWTISISWSCHPYPGTPVVPAEQQWPCDHTWQGVLQQKHGELQRISVWGQCKEDWIPLPILTRYRWNDQAAGRVDNLLLLNRPTTARYSYSLCTTARYSTARYSYSRYS